VSSITPEKAGIYVCLRVFMDRWTSFTVIASAVRLVSPDILYNMMPTIAGVVM
jgi:hypothetical protein